MSTTMVFRDPAHPDAQVERVEEFWGGKFECATVPDAEVVGYIEAGWSLHPDTVVAVEDEASKPDAKPKGKPGPKPKAKPEPEALDPESIDE